VSELPTGTVSLLFSDIEGSTMLLSRLGSAYAEALDGQRKVLRKAWAEYGGTELGTEGDSFNVESAYYQAGGGYADLDVFSPVTGLSKCAPTGRFNR
jgi:class 3 adenylate cyclase